MNNTLKYKGYIGTFGLDPSAGLFHGEVKGIPDVVTFQGRTAEELQAAFRGSVDDYLAFCKGLGREPKKPYSGRVLLRLSPALHDRAVKAAGRKSMSLNEWLSAQVKNGLKSRKSKPSPGKKTRLGGSA
jgi:predicted HicB family RNase H-like nuclease